MRIQKEAKPVLRQVEKLRERFNQRYLRHTRALQDRRLRDKNLAVRSGKEAQALTRSAEDKAVSQLQRDIKAWNSAVGERIELGKAVFLGNNHHNSSNSGTASSATDLLRSPLKESKTPSRATSVATESFDKLIVSDKLKQFLTSSSSSSQQRSGSTDGVSAAAAADGNQSRVAAVSSEDALHMLVEYFNSGGKSAEK